MAVAPLPEFGMNENGWRLKSRLSASLALADEACLRRLPDGTPTLVSVWRPRRRPLRRPAGTPLAAASAARRFTHGPANVAPSLAALARLDERRQLWHDDV